jgi:hypothetical protein
MSIILKLWAGSPEFFSQRWDNKLSKRRAFSIKIERCKYAGGLCVFCEIKRRRRDDDESTISMFHTVQHLPTFSINSISNPKSTYNKV